MVEKTDRAIMRDILQQIEVLLNQRKKDAKAKAAFLATLIYESVMVGGYKRDFARKSYDEIIKLLEPVSEPSHN
ncbi:MAG TPA: hypothetical protein VMC79_07740 [Rectinemataceae bacterium]|nr:hypothetical protein [Rectinemataceae bacterium]